MPCHSKPFVHHTSQSSETCKGRPGKIVDTCTAAHSNSNGLLTSNPHGFSLWVSGSGLHGGSLVPQTRVSTPQVSPHEFMQALMGASAKRFTIDKQSDPVDFLSWFLNTLHAELTGGKRKKPSIISRCFQARPARFP